MNSKIQALGLAIICSMANMPAFAQDDVDFTSGPCRLELGVTSSVDWLGPLGRGYEVFEGGESYETAMVEIRHSGAACGFVLTGGAGAGSPTPQLTNGANYLVYDVLTTTNGPSLLSPDYYGTQTSRVEGQFPAGSDVQVLPLLISIPAGQFVRSGPYHGQAILRLFSGEDGAELLQAETPLNIATRVAAGLEVRSPDFAPGLRETSIDLGELSDGVEREVEFAVRSNSDVNVRFRSENGGRLAHSHGAPGIEYRLNVGGTHVDPSIGGSIAMPFRQDGSETDVPIQIEVPASSEGRAAGYYRDTLTITFTVP